MTSGVVLSPQLSGEAPPVQASMPGLPKVPLLLPLYLSPAGVPLLRASWMADMLKSLSPVRTPGNMACHGFADCPTGSCAADIKSSLVSRDPAGGRRSRAPQPSCC